MDLRLLSCDLRLEDRCTALPAGACLRLQSRITNRKSNIRRGFSFAEVMFAVVVLGIGFIMVAAIFPVAISQSKVTLDEGMAAAMARGAVDVLANYATNQNMPPTSEGLDASGNPLPGRVYSIRNGPAPRFPIQAATPAPTLGPGVTPDAQLWQSVRGNLISASDPRYGWVALYRRTGDPTTGNAEPYAQVFVIVVQATATSVFTSNDIDGIPAGAPANLQARPIGVSIRNDVAAAGGIDLIDFNSASTNFNYPTVAEGAYIVIADDNNAAAPGLLNGYIYRVGRRRTDQDLSGTTAAWELIPGMDFHPHPGPDGISGSGDDITGLTGANAWIVGRAMTDGAPAYEGAAQDVYVYTTFVQVK